MEPEEYRWMAEFEDKHWWFVGRRRVIDALLKRLKFPYPSKILEVGCGTGGNLSMLATYGEVKAVEMNDYARNKAVSRGVATQIESANLPYQMPYTGEQFDVIAMFDVLEHIDQDVTTLRVLRDRLKQDGVLCLTVPAVPWLWSAHDEANHHKRRYTKRTLNDAVTQAGFTPRYVSYFNIWFFPVIALVRIAQNTLGKKAREKLNLRMPSSWLNTLCERIFSSEAAFIGKYRLPFGVSLIMSAAKA